MLDLGMKAQTVDVLTGYVLIMFASENSEQIKDTYITYFQILHKGSSF